MQSFFNGTKSCVAMWVCSFHKIGCLFLFVGALYTNKLYGKYISNLLVHFCKYPQQYYTWCSVSRVKSNLLSAADKKGMNCPSIQLG